MKFLKKFEVFENKSSVPAEITNRKIFETWLNDEDFTGEEHAINFGAWIVVQLRNGNLTLNPEEDEDRMWLYNNKPSFTEDIYKEYQNNGGLYTNYISKE